MEMDSISAIKQLGHAVLGWKREDLQEKSREAEGTCLVQREVRAHGLFRAKLHGTPLRPRVPRSVDAILRVGAVTPVEEKHAVRILVGQPALKVSTAFPRVTAGSDCETLES